MRHTLVLDVGFDATLQIVALGVLSDAPSVVHGKSNVALNILTIVCSCKINTRPLRLSQTRSCRLAKAIVWQQRQQQRQQQGSQRQVQQQPLARSPQDFSNLAEIEHRRCQRHFQWRRRSWR
jgi:hypothetical protein